MANHKVTAAFPKGGSATADEIHLRLADAFALVLHTADEIQSIDFSAANAIAVPHECRLFGVAFIHDPADTTSVHDGVSTLVSQDGKRYIAEFSPGAFTNVKSVENSPPAGAVVGDKHIVGVAPTGDFAANANDLTVLTSRGWSFVSPVIGQVVYDRNAAGQKHWSEAGAWTVGIGADSVVDASITPRKLKWPFGARVESETATPPGGTPAAGTLYLVAASATGAWAGRDTEIAEADGAGGWTFHTAAIGMRLFNAGTGGDIQFTADGWGSAAGASVDYASEFEATTGTSSTGGSGAGGYSATVAPTSSQDYWQDDNIITHTAKQTGAKLRFEYQAKVDPVANDFEVALFRDSDVDAIDWVGMGESGSSQETQTVNVIFEVTAPDTNSHEYKVRFISGSTVTRPASATRRRFTLEEMA